MSTFWADWTFFDKALMQTVEEVSAHFLFSPVQMLLQTYHSLPWTDSNMSYSLETGCAHVYVLWSFFFFYQPMSTSFSLYARHSIGELHLWEGRNRVGFTGVCSLLQCRNKGSLAAPSNGLCLSCTDHKLLLFCLNCSPSKDLTRMHFGLYSIQSSFCPECSLAPRFNVDLISTGLLSATCLSLCPREAALLTSRKLEGGIASVMEGWEISVFWKSSKMNKWLFWSLTSAVKPTQMKAISICYGLIQIQTSLTNNTLMKVWVHLLRGPGAH